MQHACNASLQKTTTAAIFEALDLLHHHRLHFFQNFVRQLFEKPEKKLVAGG